MPGPETQLPVPRSRALTYAEHVCCHGEEIVLDFLAAETYFPDRQETALVLNLCCLHVAVGRLLRLMNRQLTIT